jgi:shikimate kinase
VTPRRVVLWGFMASGKTAVGAALARRLAWEHLDLDAEVVRRAGCSIAELFRTRGEPEFRRLEAEATAAVIDREEVVLSPGGGWITNPDLPRLLPAGHHVERLEVVLDVHTEARPLLPLHRGGDVARGLREVANVTHRRRDAVAGGEEAANGLRLGGRFHHHEAIPRRGAGRTCLLLSRSGHLVPVK